MAHTRSKSSSVEKASHVQEAETNSLCAVKEIMKAQETAMKAFFETFVENTNKRIDRLTNEVREVVQSLEYSQAELRDLKQEVKDIAKITASQHREVESNIANNDARISAAIERIDELEQKTDDLQNRSRRNNLCFDGVKEDVNEQWPVSERKIRDILTLQN